jgi:hypothetical protein
MKSPVCIVPVALILCMTGFASAEVTYSGFQGITIPSTFDGSLVNLTAIPEAGGLLAVGCLVGSGVWLRIRRRRL